MRSMSASNSRTAATRLGQYVAGPIITLATACVLELLKRDHVTLPNPGVPLTLTIVLSFFLSGSVPGSVSAVLAWVYNACYFSLPDRPFQYTEDNVERVMIAGLAIPALAVMLWFLKHRADQSAELMAFAARLETQLAEQQRSEARIRQAEAAGWDTARYLRTIIAAEPECVKLLAPDGTLLDMNPAGLAMLDCDSLAAAQSVPLCEFVAVEHRAAFDELHGQVMRGESRTLEFEIVSRCGSRRRVETHAVPLRDQGGQITAVLGITRDITERKHAENQLIEYAARLRTLSGQTLANQENERRHIARELHDEIGQVLTAVAINLHAVKASVGTSAWPTVDESLDVVNQAIEQVRNMSLDLRPSMLDDLGLEAALRWHLDRQAQRGGFAVQFVSELAGQRPPPDIETVCFRVAQEALTNISRHAHATNVVVELRRCADETQLIIQDNGAGFDVKSTRRRADRGHTFGLSGMHERVALAGGKIAVDSEPGRGTRICASFANRSADSSVAGGLDDETDPNSFGGRS